MAGMKPCKTDDSMASLRPRKCLEYFENGQQGINDTALSEFSFVDILALSEAPRI